MRVYFFIFSLFFSCVLWGNILRPCQRVNFERLVSKALPADETLSFKEMSIQDKKEYIILLKKCIKNYSACMVERDTKSSNWFLKYLKEPLDRQFDPVERELVFGLIQYFDQKKGESVCIIARNSFGTVVPWFGLSWVRKDNKTTEYEFWGGRFTTVMTPKSLYHALLSEYSEARVTPYAIKHL